MSIEPQHTARDPAPEHPELPLPPVTGEGWPAVSRWMLRRTTDVIAIALILLGGLTVAQRLVVWWRTDPVQTLADPQAAFAGDALAPWGVGPGGATLEFGGAAFTLRRETVRGTLDEALQHLQSICREQLLSPAATTGPTAELSLPALPPIEPREAALLEKLSAVDPVERAADDAWSLYRTRGPLAAVIGVRGRRSDATAERVICWGLCLPLDQEAWALLVVAPGAASAAGRETTRSVTIPADARLGVSLRDELGGGLLTFSGGGRVEEWQVHFDRMANERGWTLRRPWTTAAGSRSAAWNGPVGDLPRRIDVHLTRGESGWEGLVSLSPIRVEASAP